MRSCNKFSIGAVILCTLIIFIIGHHCLSDKDFQRKMPLDGISEKETELLLASVRSAHAKENTVKHTRSSLVYSPSYYDSCGQNNKRCFPNSEDECFQQRNCTYLVIWQLLPVTNYIEFQVIVRNLTDKTDGKLCSEKLETKNTTRYVALGFSGRSSKNNENLAVIECSLNQFETESLDRKVRLAWSSKNEYMVWNYICTENTTNGKLTLCKVDLHKESILCHFQVQQRIVLNQAIYNFGYSQYHLHLTSGCDISDIKKTFLNGGKYVTPDVIIHFHPSDETVAVSFRTNYALWHGTLMTLAWCVLIPNGVFFSRYFKESFVNFSILKYRIWYAGHTVIMISAFLITIGSVGVIFYERSEVDFAWPVDERTQLHFNLGIAASLALVCQVTIGWIRCHGRKLRRTFGTIHLFIGIICYIIALVVIGLSYHVGMPCNVVYYTLATGLWTVVCHVAMTIHFYYIDKQLGLLIYRAFYPFPISAVTYDELPGSTIRLIIFLLHFAVNVLISTLMILEYLSKESCKY